MNVTYWLRKSPVPAAVLADDNRIEIPKNKRAWRDLNATIESLEPSRLTALDVDGNVIRSITLESEDEKPAAPAPSQHMTDVQLFANLIAEAYDKASSKMQPVVDSAMAFVERNGERLAKAESENDRLRAHIHKLSVQVAELGAAAPAAGDDSLMGAIMAGALQAANPLGAVTPLKQGAKK